DFSTDQQTQRVGDNLALAAFDLLAGIIAARTAALGGLDRLAVDDPRRRAGFAAGRFAGLQQQRKIGLFQNPAVTPRIKVVLHRRERRKLPRQLTPLAARPGDVEERVNYRPQLDFPRSPQRSLPRQLRLDHRPLPVGHVACVPLLLALILRPSDFGSHVATLLLLDTTSVPQLTEITQFIFGQPLNLTASVIGNSCHVADRRIAARTSRESPGERDDEPSAHRRDRVGDVPFGSDRRHLWVGNPGEWQIAGAAGRNLLLRGEGRRVRRSESRRRRYRAWRGGESRATRALHNHPGRALV